MDSTTSYDAMSYGTAGYEFASGKSASDDLEQWANLQSSRLSIREKRLRNRPGKKRRRPLRKNRKPSRPTSHFGLRTNNRLLRVCRKATEVEKEG